MLGWKTECPEMANDTGLKDGIALGCPPILDWKTERPEVTAVTCLEDDSPCCDHRYLTETRSSRGDR